MVLLERISRTLPKFWGADDGLSLADVDTIRAIIRTSRIRRLFAALSATQHFQQLLHEAFFLLWLCGCLLLRCRSSLLLRLPSRRLPRVDGLRAKPASCQVWGAVSELRRRARCIWRFQRHPLTASLCHILAVLVSSYGLLARRWLALSTSWFWKLSIKPIWS